MKDEVLKMAAEFDKRFTSMNGIDVPERVSVPRDEWRALNQALKQALAAPVQEPDLIARLKHPEDHYEFSDPKKANAVLMSLCQEAADAFADIKQDLTPVQEPVAWIFKPHRELLWPNEVERKNPLELNEYAPLYTTLLAQPAPVPDLTHDQWDEWQDKHGLILEREALDELRSMIYTAAAQPEPVQQERGEPVAWMDASGDIYKYELWPDWNPPHTPLYITPPAQPAPIAFEVGLVEWVGNKLMATPKTTTTPPASWVEMVTANLVREGVNKHKARELAEHFYSLAQPAPVQEPWEPHDTAHRPGGLPQDFIKHEVENEGDWSEWVNPKPEQYFMKCCDCGLVHEMQFKIAKYSEGDECEFVADADLQAVFRARRTAPPAPVQEHDEWLTGCPECGMDSGCDCDSGTWNPPAQPAPVQPEPCCGKYETCTQACAPRGKFLAKREAQAAPTVQEPVAYQQRTRPNWMDETCWTPWEDCSKSEAEDCWNRPRVHDWLYEARALYTTPPAQPAPVQEPVGRVCFEGDEVVWTDEPPESGTLLYTPPPAQSAPECTRSHPHENMDAMCELRTEIARLTNENARLKAQPAPASWMEMVVANLVREGVSKHKARELAEHFYSLAQRQFVGLTDEELELLNDCGDTDSYKFARAIEAKLKEKNGM